MIAREQGLGEHVLFRQRVDDGRAAPGDLGQDVQLVADGGDRHLVEGAGRLLAVAGDKGNGGAGGEQVDGGLDLVTGESAVIGDGGDWVGNWGHDLPWVEGAAEGGAAGRGWPGRMGMS